VTQLKACTFVIQKANPLAVVRLMSFMIKPREPYRFAGDFFISILRRSRCVLFVTWLFLASPIRPSRNTPDTSNRAAHFNFRPIILFALAFWPFCEEISLLYT
jgi:hypothetical protein